MISSYDKDTLHFGHLAKNDPTMSKKDFSGHWKREQLQLSERVSFSKLETWYKAVKNLV